MSTRPDNHRRSCYPERHVHSKDNNSGSDCDRQCPKTVDATRDPVGNDDQQLFEQRLLKVLVRSVDARIYDR